MIDLEDRARDSLGRLASSVRSRVELDVVIKAGRRLRWRRRAGWAVAGAALVAGVVGGTALLPHGVESAVVVATPSPYVTPSVTAAPTETGRDWTNHVATLTKPMSQVPGGESLGVTSITITLRAQPGSDVEVKAITTAGKTVVQSGVVSDGAPMLAKVNDKVWVMVTPGEVQWAEGARVGGGLLFAGTDTVEGLGVIIAVGEENSKIAGFIWADVDGTVRSDRGDVVPSAEVKLGGRTFRFAHDLDLRIACGQEVKAGRSDADECSDLTAKSGRGLSDDLAEAGGGAGQEENTFFVLPEGASDWSADRVAGCSVGSGTLQPSGRTVLLALCHVTGDGNGKVPAIHYRDASGQRVTYRR